MSGGLKFLVIEDSELDFALIERELKKWSRQVECHRVENLEELRTALEWPDWNLVISDYNVPGIRFEDTLAQVTRCLPETPVILLSGYIGEEKAVELLKQGARDFVLKDNLVRFLPAIKRCLSDVEDSRHLKQIENELRISHETFRHLLDTTLDGFCQLDRQGRLIDVNPAYCRKSGYSREELLEMSIGDLEATESGAETAAHIAKIIAKSSDLFESRHRRKDGSIWHVEVSATFRDIAGGQLFSFLRDITERKQAEEELRRSNAELEQFSYAISHDMRQPLRMIASYLHLLEKHLVDQLDAEKREFLNYAKDGAKRLDQMLLGLLEYSRVGRKGEPPAWVESRGLLEEALLFLRPAISESQAVVRIEGDWPRVFVSPDEMVRLLQNLIGNAVKFRIGGRTPEIMVTSAKSAEGWRVCIADNGAGLVPEQIGRLFQVFQRLQSRAAYEGTGIGLALCRKIAERHGGRIWADSAGPGEGSRFCFELPQETEE
ncbi:MAG: ATP-binding protein [Sterolibacterium sp.]